MLHGQLVCLSVYLRMWATAHGTWGCCREASLLGLIGTPERRFLSETTYQSSQMQSNVSSRHASHESVEGLVFVYHSAYVHYLASALNLGGEGGVSSTSARLASCVGARRLQLRWLPLPSSAEPTPMASSPLRPRTKTYNPNKATRKVGTFSTRRGFARDAPEGTVFQ